MDFGEGTEEQCRDGEESTQRGQLWGWKGEKISGSSSILSNQPDEGEQANCKLGQLCR